MLVWIVSYKLLTLRPKCRAPGCQREYESVAAVNTVVLHPNQVTSTRKVISQYFTEEICVAAVNTVVFAFLIVFFLSQCCYVVTINFASFF